MGEKYVKSKQPNPDNRFNNVERLHDMIENTQKKLQEAEVSMEFANPEEREVIKHKNERRKQSIKAMKEEMKEEMDARIKGEI
ncbi:small acid-soluble spore protein Tlp [Lysinibacillus telephonicus]|uniref:Small, acid-soluble spore protein Tlp n=1 Tax=Lysinibacillus telephonicus TaxID=1714840 RepID=A0A431UVE9_9BACI|nr:small acid-soluble spore protein Tlp [Lysinibacillus telephonicus]RTQ95058.1 small acid-soluble spore protein Tlp [Lysinibacillus telephonicus]